MVKRFFSAMVAVCAATAVWAAELPVSGKEAKKMLFSPRGAEFVVVPQDFMTDRDVQTLNLMSGMKEFKSVLYYGAIAASPKRGLAHKATVASANHHGIAAAEAQAIKECNALRGGGPKCVVVAHILPRKFSEQPLQLSTSATTAFKRTYLKGRGAKAMAISPSTGQYAIAKGDGANDAAITACNKAASEMGAKDCKVVIEDH